MMSGAPSLHGFRFAVVPLEGMAAATPVVASDPAGYRNVARPDYNGCCSPHPRMRLRWPRPGDEPLDRGPDVVAMISHSGLERAAAFSLDSLARRYMELY